MQGAVKQNGRDEQPRHRAATPSEHALSGEVRVAGEVRMADEGDVRPAARRLARGGARRERERARRGASARGGGRADWSGGSRRAIRDEQEAAR
ncbi:hypothetical protein [Herbiconiux daphne]|uniref:Uncharacterized protein n=1 Tax=Herbiconiux daphne TaxID=2970914 RepID=A0ABT2GW93_9MICO|nr:hypothetical protein [Herbiconiux daphne]MCS5732231.1 hypothetical protein [Herbiconiux daphne]